MEEGELIDHDSSGMAYSPALEWPGDTTAESSTSCDTVFPQAASIALQGMDSHPASSSPVSRACSDTSCLRLLVQQSSILSRRHSLAVLDGHTEVHIGRDAAPSGSETPRIRLKEMEVSKLHATIYWELERREWAVVDMGSKHGTFLRSHRENPSTSEAGGQASPQMMDATDGYEKGMRLSAPRTASIPRRLAHLDSLSVGGTAFLVHMHEQVPCTECSPSAGNEIALFDRRGVDRQAEASRKRKRDTAERQAVEGNYIAPARDPKRALNDLRRNLLSRHVPTHSATAQPQYTDRSAIRRARHHEAAPIPPSRARKDSIATAMVSRASAPSPTPPPVSTPPAPLPATNIGHRLLQKQGWSPGESLGAGSSDIALVEPLDIKANRGKVGLGGAAHDRQPSSPAHDWKEAGKLRQWDSVQARTSGGPP
ncbi:hypothetical protein C8Q72DRAFT_454408 [Fomitopsis betulina]|nr:hypothetical protein C8Q72DRAFT_454408 [Fomitopsis betulina]